MAMRVQTRVARAGGATSRWCLGFGLALAILFLSGCAAQAAGEDDDVSAGYDQDGTLVLDSRNFHGMTQQGVWLVMFYSYSVVIKRREEAWDCQRMSYLISDLAARMQGLGGSPRGGSSPSIHVAKFDTSSEGERRFASVALQASRIESLPALVLFDGSEQVKMPEAMVQQIVANFPDLDRLEGYSPDMTCDPPSDYYDARYKNEGNLFAIIHWLNDHLMTTRRMSVEVPSGRAALGKPDDPGVDFEWRYWDPAEKVLELARVAVRTGDRAPLERHLGRMVAVNGSGVDCRCPSTLQTPLHFAAIAGEAEVAALLVELGADCEAACEDGETPLHKAAEGARRGAVRELLARGAWANVPRHTDGASPLHMAALTGEGDVCSLLVRGGADVELRTPKGQSPLHFAAIGGYVHETGAVDALLAAGADIEGQDHMGWTPLMHAVFSGEEAMAARLLARGAAVDSRDWTGNTALHHALHYGHEEMVRLLLVNGADVFAENRQGQKAHEVLSAWNNWRVDAQSGKTIFHGEKKREFDRMLRPYKHGWFPGFWFGPWMREPGRGRCTARCGGRGGAAGLRRGARAKDLIHSILRAEDRAKAWVRERAEAVRWHLRTHWHGFYKFFILAGGKPSKYEAFTQRRLLEVEEFNDKQTPGGDNEGDVFLFHMGDPEYERLKSYSELQRAVYCGETHVVAQLLANRRVVWAQGEDSSEADVSQVVIPSTGGGRIESGLGALRTHGSDVDIEVKDEEGATPLIVAAARGDVPTLHVLLRAGARLDARDDFGWTALMRAARVGDTAVVRMLLTAGAAPDARNEADAGQTALMLAAEGGHEGVMVELLTRGADLDAPDAVGRTPLNYAFSARAARTVAWLRRRGACMSVDGVTAAALPGLAGRTDFGGPGLADYTPADHPEQDARNPRFVGNPA